MKNSPIDISFVIVNYNGFEDTSELLISLQKWSYQKYFSEIIVVDNGSKEDESKKIMEKFPEISVLRSSINLGFSGGYNLGISKSIGRYIMILNNDTIIVDNSLFGMIDFLDNNPIIGAASPKIYFSGQGNIIQYAGFTELSPITLRNRAIGYLETEKDLYNNPEKTFFTHGAAMIIRREIIEKVGLLPDIFFLYYEELDWCYRIRAAGYEIWYYSHAKIIHKESRSTGSGDTYLKKYYKTRNRLLLAKRNRKGINKYLSFIYLISVAATKDIISSLFKGRFDLIKASFIAIFDFINLKTK